MGEALLSQAKEVIKLKLTKRTKGTGMLLLSIWLIVSGLLQVVSIPIPSIDILLAVLAVASGVFILLGR